MKTGKGFTLISYFLEFIMFSSIHTVLPLITPFAFDEKTFAGENVQITCFVPKGDTPLKISWVFDGQDSSSSQLGMSTSRIGERMSVLMIESLMASHSGNYTCTAANYAGKANFTATLEVSG